ncbi:MAG: TRAP transporter large permease subunit, partial [Betaproteobacteria bacterium]|nr:TRAP transporter large permease subunit [Betaproteobacteria bacterium]
MLTVIAIAAFVLLFLGIPMWMIFLILAIGAMTWQGVSMEVVVQGLSGTINKLVLLAVPGFIFAGGIMGEGGMSARLIVWVSALMGRLPGGMALTTITAAELFGAISGSSTATVAGLGKILYPALLKEGYR